MGDCAQVTLEWDRNTEPDLAGYRIYYGTTSRSYNWFIDVGNVRTYTVTGLADGSTYYFAATAYDKSKKESTYSSEAVFNSCTFSLSSPSSSVGQSGGTGTVEVSTQPGCSWTAKSGAIWFKITSGRQGTGSGSVSYSVSSNASSSARTVASTIAGRVFTVNQAGGGATYTITSSAGNGGSVSPSGTTALSQGTNKIFTIKPDAGYKVSDVRVDGVSVSAVTRYTFRNVQSNHTISVRFTGIEEPGEPDKTNSFNVTVSKVSKNKGDGIVTTSDRNINCGESCAYSYKQGSMVTFIARASTGSTFGGWKPASLECSTDTCTVTIDKAKKVRAVFIGNYALEIVNISKDGGRGRVTSSPWAMDCVTDTPGDCEATYSYDKEVTLSAYPASGSSFVGWSPASLCPGTGKCVVPMDRQRIIKATFSKP